MVSGFIDDGQEVEGFIPEKQGCYPDVSFWFRPTDTREKDRTLDRIKREEKRGRQGAFVDIATRFVSGKILSWDLSRNGKPAEISKANVEKLHPDLFENMFLIVLGSQEPGTGEPPAQETEEEQEGNSEAG